MGVRFGLFRGLSLRQLELLAIIAPLLFLAVLYWLSLGAVHPVFHSWPGFLVLAPILGTIVWLFAGSVFGAVRSLQREVETLSALTQRHNQQLTALHGAGLALMRETRVDNALRRTAELGAQLLTACHASLAVLAPDGSFRVFAHPSDQPGVTPRCAIEAAAHTGAALHMVSDGDRRLIALPVAHLGTPVGTLRLARAHEAEPFTANDLEVARMFATHAALVIQNDRLSDQVQTLAVETERHALAREMHDSFAQVLAFVNVKAQAVEQYLRNGDESTARQQMAELSAAAREVYTDIREGISVLRVDMSGKPLRELLDECCTLFGESSGLRVGVAWSLADGALYLPPTSELQLVRIVQEALTNVRRHAAADTVAVRASVDDGTLVIVIADDGRGFHVGARYADRRPRFGLQTMAERANAIGGTLVVKSTPGAGTEVRVCLPGAAHVAINGDA